MPNNIIPLQQEIERRKKEDEEIARENFNRGTELTEAEREKLEELKTETHTVVVETDAEGRRSETPVDTYAEPLDSRVAEIEGIVSAADKFKTVNQGDIRQTADELKEASRKQAIEAFRDLSVTDTVYDDEDILRINDLGLQAVKDYLKVDRFDANDITKKLGKLTLRQITDILPEEFNNIYVRPNEIKANNIKAKERLITAIAYLSITGPEMDYLNDYIDNENRLMEVSKRAMECQVSFLEVLKSEDKMSEIVREADKIHPQDRSIWSKAISTDPKIAYDDLTQRAVISLRYKDAYMELIKDYAPMEESAEFSGEKLRQENEFRAKARDIINAEIEECQAKYDVYTSVYYLDLLEELWKVLIKRYSENKKGLTPKYLKKEAIASLDRIRKAKQNVPFPVYDERLAKRPEELYKLYIQKFSEHLMNYNTVVKKVTDAHPEEVAETEVTMVHIDGINDDSVRELFAEYLLIIFGRIMKKLSGDNITKYDAITLDAYFQLYCRVGSDLYLTSELWSIMKTMVEYTFAVWANADTSKYKLFEEENG